MNSWFLDPRAQHVMGNDDDDDWFHSEVAAGVLTPYTRAIHPVTYDCWQCDREFRSEGALDQHTRAAHPLTYECKHCDRWFGSEEAVKQHTQAVHTVTYECKQCDREFRSEGALDQHTRAAHQRISPSSLVNGRVPSSPVDEPGEWVPLDEFTGRKSFGFFVCTGCRKTWRSAHAFKAFKQGCQRCNKESDALLMWQNYGHRRASSDEEDDEDSTEDNDGPHDKARCEAGRYGMCDACDRC